MVFNSVFVMGEEGECRIVLGLAVHILAWVGTRVQYGGDWRIIRDKILMCLKYARNVYKLGVKWLFSPLFI